MDVFPIDFDKYLKSKSLKSDFRDWFFSNRKEPTETEKKLKMSI